MTKFFQTQEFNELQKEWDERLKNNGFVDIEKEIGSEKVLIQHAVGMYKKQKNWRMLPYKSKYFSLITECISETEFGTHLDEAVMLLVAEGKNITEIVRKLSKRGTDVHRQTVRFIIRRYEMKWKIKNWTLKQMNLKVPML